MEKKIMRKAAARRLSATLMALVLLVAAITPAGEAFASEFDFGGGIFDAVKSVEETQPAQQNEAPEFDFGGGKEEAQEELPVYVPTVTEPPVTETDKMESVGDTAETLNAADVTVVQGGNATYSLNYAEWYSYSVSPADNGVTVSASGSTVTVTASATAAVGTYTVTYSSRFGSGGSFTVQVTEDGSGTGTGTPEVEETQRMSMDKVATARGDGTYDLTLSLSGSIGSQTNKAKVDVIFIVDNSNSMYDSNRYMQSLRPAMQKLIDNLSTTNSEKIDARYAIAMFGTNSEIRQNFTDAATARTRIGNISQYSSQNGGTNYQAGIYQGKALLNSVRDGATSIVIFVTDGLPTFRGAPNKTGGSGQEDDDGENIEAAVEEISSMNCNYFYCIGIGDNFVNTSSTEYSNMTKLTGNVNAKTTGIHKVSSNDVSGLTDVFETISAEVTSFLCSNVTITDTLSNVSGALLVEVTDPSTVMVEVITPEGTYGPAPSVTLPETKNDKGEKINDETTLIPSYKDGVLTLVFPDDYQLEAGYTYKLHAIIEPTEKAYQEYREKGYTGTGDAGTGTHAGEKGIYCNESATVTYTYKGEAGSATYNHPVIQLHPGTLVINKQIVDMDEENLAELTFPVTLTYPDGTVENLDLPLGLFTYNEETDTYTIPIEGLSPGTTYTVTETGETVEKYNVATTVNGEEGKEASGSVAMDATETVSFVNTYTVAVTNLTLDKVVTGNLGDWTKDFTFTVYVDGEVFGTYTLNHNTEVVTIEEVPIGSKVEIVESDNEPYAVSATVDGVEATVTDSTVTIEEVGMNGHAIVFTNHYSETVETGITLDSMPYITILVIAGAAFFFVMLRKRMAYED